MELVPRRSAVTPPATVSFKYDPFGRRIYKSSSAGTSIFAYDASALIEEVNSSGAVVARYTPGENIDEPLAMLRGGATSFYHADGLGSVTSLSNAAGALAQTYTFDSFGNQTASSRSLTNSFRYTGREFDTETNLYFYRARCYDPTAGHFLTEDPVRSPLQPNRHRYVRNNPLSRVDSSGMTDQPPYPPGMWGKYRGCKLVSTLSLTLWTSESGRTPTGDWSFVGSFAEAPRRANLVWWLQLSHVSGKERTALSGGGTFSPRIPGGAGATVVGGTTRSLPTRSNGPSRTLGKPPGQSERPLTI